MLVDDQLGAGTVRQIRGELQSAQEHNAFSETPYGRVVQ